jgi:hypothetical protein
VPYATQPSLHLGPVTIHAYGVIVALSAFLGLEVARRRFRRLGLDQVLGEGLANTAAGAELPGRKADQYPREVEEDGPRFHAPSRDQVRKLLEESAKPRLPAKASARTGSAGAIRRAGIGTAGTRSGICSSTAVTTFFPGDL